MTDTLDPRVKQLLDGELTLADLPPELQAEGEEALRLLAAVDRRPVHLADITTRVMAAVRDRASRRTVWSRFAEPREIRIRVRPWFAVPALAAAAVLVLLLSGPRPSDSSLQLVTVRFVLVAPDARQVSVAGTFNQWNPDATPLVRSTNGGGGGGIWSATLTLPAGSHQYAFVVDGTRWVPDPGAPAVDDGFGRRNSVLAL